MNRPAPATVVFEMLAAGFAVLTIVYVAYASDASDENGGDKDSHMAVVSMVSVPSLAGVSVRLLRVTILERLAMSAANEPMS